MTDGCNLRLVTLSRTGCTLEAAPTPAAPAAWRSVCWCLAACGRQGELVCCRFPIAAALSLLSGSGQASAQ